MAFIGENAPRPFVIDRSAAVVPQRLVQRLLGRIPVPVKRLLRPLLVLAVKTVARLPGGRRGALRLAAVMPGTAGWIWRRYDAYRRAYDPTSKATGAEFCDAAAIRPADLSGDELVRFRWLSTAAAGRRGRLD